MSSVITTDLHATDIDGCLTENATDHAYHPRLVVIPEEGHVVTDRYVDIKTIDFHDLRNAPRAGRRPCDAHRMTARQRQVNADQRAMITRLTIRGQRNFHTALLRQDRGVDEGDRIVHQHLEDTLERRKFQDSDVMIDDITKNFDVDALDGLRSE